MTRRNVREIVSAFELSSLEWKKRFSPIVLRADLRNDSTWEHRRG
jgi:hypothetical protein